MWDAATGKPLVEFGDDGVLGLAMAPNGKLLALATNGTLRLAEVPSGKDVTPLNLLAGTAQAVAFSPQGDHLAMVDDAAAVQVLEWATAQVQRKLQGPAQILAVAFTPDGRTIVTGHGHAGAYLKFWDRETGSERSLIQRPENVFYLAASPDGKVLATREGTNKVCIWSLAAPNKPLHEWVLPGQTYKLALAPDGRHLAVANGDGTVWLLRLPMR
jgi:WD40 repeat protein